MQYDRHDVESTSMIVDRRLTIRYKHKPTGVQVERIIILGPDECGHAARDRNNDMMHGLLREEISQKLPAGQPDRLVRITQSGCHRIIWAKPGWLFVVHCTTESPRGEVVHVKDSAGNNWTLGVGDYEDFDQNWPDRSQLYAQEAPA